MKLESWISVKGRILDTFADAQVTTAELEAPQRGQAETIVFTSPAGRMMLERITRPVIVNTITHGGRRAGSEHSVDYVYDESQTTDQVKLYRWQDGDWQEMDINALNLN